MLPEEFQQRFEALCPDHLLDAAQASFEQPKAPSFRVNQLQAEPAAVVDALTEEGVPVREVAWAGQAGVAAYQCPPALRDSLTHSRAAEAGDIYIQSLSSMLAPILLDPQPDEWVLDLAAAPGGKTILLAEMMANQGAISAVEPVKSRFFRLKANLDRCGVDNTRVYMKDGRAVGKLKPDSFDRVLLDAPCSSESRLRADDPDSYAHWSLRKVAECARKQRRLAISAFDALKPGGVMCYCTCSYAPEENEAVVAHLLNKREQAEVLEIDPPIANVSAGVTEWQGKTFVEDCDKTLRVWPTREMDGFYLALLKKVA